MKSSVFCNLAGSNARNGISSTYFKLPQRWHSMVFARLYSSRPASTKVNGTEYTVDEWTNVPPHILAHLNRRLHLQKDHPLRITRQLIESRFPEYKTHNNYFPIVTTKQNFDALDIPVGHPGRSKTDTYYLNATHLLRTHTSAHQDDTFRANTDPAWLISADVYRRDAVDRSHYPIFHQMEGARVWDRKQSDGNVTSAVLRDLEKIPKHDLVVDDPNPTYHKGNPLQPEHTAEECEAIATHLKRSLENVVVEIFSQAKQAAVASGDVAAANAEPLKVRWIEAYFPFTSPSWELEVWYNDEWLEVLGCGVVLQKLLKQADVPDQLGWAFGVGLERIAMLLFNIPDIRLFWSEDPRFLSQFDESSPVRRFAPFSKYPECYKDVSFWVNATSNAAGGGGGRANTQDFHENDVMEIVRTVGGDLVEDVRLVDEFTHPKTRRKSMCYRINYRSLERTLTNEEVNQMHDTVCKDLVDKMGVEIR